MTGTSFLEAPGLPELFGQAKRDARREINPVGPKAHIEYQTRPLDWMVDKLGVERARLHWSLNPGYESHKWDGTADPFMRLLDALGSWERVIAVESGNGTGKTWCGGHIALWFLACFPKSLVVTWAPKEDQLTKHIWKEITDAWPAFRRHFPLAKKGELSIEMIPGNESWAISGFAAGVAAEEAAGSATRAQGFHAEHMLHITEETPGVPSPVIKAIKNTCSAPHNVRLGFGNPDHQLDELHQMATAPNAVAIRISALDHPNVVTGNPSLVPGAVSQQQIDERALDYDEHSPLYQSRVRGISPAQSVASLIRKEWLDRALTKTPEQVARLRRGKKSLGVDAAQSANGDAAAIARGEGAVADEVVAFACPNATTLGEDVVKEARERGIDPFHIGVDPVGVGAATANALCKEPEWDKANERWLGGLGSMVQCLGGGASPVDRAQRAADGSSYEWVPDANLFDNLRSQMAWQLREDLRNDRIAVMGGTHTNAGLIRQLMLLRFETKGGKTKVVPKDVLKKVMGGASPNEADALMYWNWARYRREPDPEPVALVNPLVMDTTDFSQPAPPAWYDALANMPSDF